MAPLWDRLGELTMAVVVLAGERDAKFVALARRLAGALPGATLTVVPGAGHALPLEAPAAVAAAIDGRVTCDATRTALSSTGRLFAQYSTESGRAAAIGASRASSRPSAGRAARSIEIELLAAAPGSGRRSRNASTAGVAQPLGSTPSTPWPMPRSMTTPAAERRREPARVLERRAQVEVAGQHERRDRRRQRRRRRHDARSRAGHSPHSGSNPKFSAARRSNGASSDAGIASSADSAPGCGGSPGRPPGPTRTSRPRTSSPRRRRG